MNDGKIASNIESFPLENITVPTLLISAKYDLWKTYATAQYTASNIPDAKLVGFDIGGHMLNGHEEKVRSDIASLLRQMEPIQR